MKVRSVPFSGYLTAFTAFYESNSMNGNSVEGVVDELVRRKGGKEGYKDDDP